MEATSTSNKIGRSSPGDILSTRGGAMAVATVAAILAGILLFVFVQRYRNSQSAASATTTVFVAHSLIPQGSSADVVASEQLLQRTTLRGSQVQAGAIADPSVLHGEVAATNIYPGQQITAADFTLAGTIASELTATQRAVSVPVDSAHGLIGLVHTGDYVDVLASYTGAGANRGSVSTLLQDVLVLSAAGAAAGGLGGGSANSNIVLRASRMPRTTARFGSSCGPRWARASRHPQPPHRRRAATDDRHRDQGARGP
jgi:Flp pilus assembly protein CpaB